jgi:hypothetical protein
LLAETPPNLSWVARVGPVEPIGFAHSGGVIFVDESAKKIATM